MKKFKLKSEFITMAQLIKVEGFVSTGGEAKLFLLAHQVFKNDQRITTRKTKLLPGDIVKIDQQLYEITL